MLNKTKDWKTPVAAIAIFLGTLIGCGGGGSSAPDITYNDSNIRLSPTAVTTNTGTPAVFSVVMTGKIAEGGYSLAVQEPDGGAISGTTYFPPPVPGVYHVVATADLNPAITGTAVVTVTQGPTVPGASLDFLILGPGDPPYTYVVGGSYQLFLFMARGSAATGSGLPAVDFSVVEPSGGTISPSSKNPDIAALYTAPATPGTYTIKCTLRSDPSITAVKTIAVVAQSGN